VACSLGAACHRDPTVVTRTVTLHVPDACAADGGAYATFYQLGDFEPPTPQAGHLLGAVGASLPEIDPRAKTLVVQASEAVEASVSRTTWTGVADVPGAGDVDVLLLPQFAWCALNAPAQGQRLGATMAAIAPRRVMIAGGVEISDAGTTPHTFLANLDTGSIEAVSPDLLTPRSHASVTAFGAGALVAGGVDPFQLGTVLQTAEVYDPNPGGFDQQNALMLGAPRSEHGAVVLATGETLLVGGVGGDGTTPLKTMEVIDPATRIVRSEGVALLTVARRNPTVLVLASGEVLVAGGFDASGAPVSTLEWFTSDVSRELEMQSLASVGSAQAFTALQGGGALAVIAPPANAPVDFQSVWEISANRQPQAAALITGALSTPVLFGGAQGAPVLWTGDRWLRWQPWERSFGALDVLDAASTPMGDLRCSPDPGLAAWLDPTGNFLDLLRFDTSNANSTLPPQLLVTAPCAMSPELPSDPLATGTCDLAPDRLSVTGVVAFDAQSTEGQLELGPGDSAFVTDRTYEDVAIDVIMPTDAPAAVVLADANNRAVVVGDATTNCAADPGTGPSTLHVERHGQTVTWSASNGASGTCTGTFDATARLSIGLRGRVGATLSAAQDLRVTRLGP
jgi:hypothetical protein